MPAPYNLPNNVTDVVTFGDYINQVTDYWFGISILLAVGIIFFTILSIRYSTRMSVVGTGIVTSLMAILWRFAGMINDFVMFTTLIICGIGAILFLYFTRED
jgi:hypothetical protein